MRVHRDGRDFKVVARPDGGGLVSHSGSAVLAGVAEKTGLMRALSRDLAGLKVRRSGHDLGRVVRDLAVMLAGGGDCLADLGALGDQAALFGPACSSATAFRVIDRVASDPDRLERLRAAHARARARVWELECRHRARAHVEDHIRNDKDTGMRNLPFKDFEHNRIWLQIVLIAHDLITWLKRLLLTGKLASEPARQFELRVKIPAVGEGRTSDTSRVRPDCKCGFV